MEVVGGDGELVAIYEELWDQWPDRIQIKTGNDEAFRHQLIAASDFVVVPGAALGASRIVTKNTTTAKKRRLQRHHWDFF